MGRVMDKDPTGRTIIITGGRLSFGESLKEKQKPKKADDDAKAVHSCNIILESDHKDFKSNQAAVIAACKAAAREFKKPETWWKDLFDDDPKQICFRQGRRFKNSDTGEIYAGYEGNLVIVGKGPRGGENRPKLKDRRKRDVEEKDILDVCYNGTYGDFIVSFYATDKGGTQRITCSVEAIRSHEEGERMGGGGITVDDDDFDDLPDDDSFGDDEFGGERGGGSVVDDADDDLLG
jgi:hypothetical protein